MLAIALLLLTLACPVSALDSDSTIYIGIDADLSAGAKPAGDAIVRGAQLAIDEINAAGGLLSRPVALTLKDHRGNPRRGIDNIAELAQQPNLVAIVGGVHTPVALNELDLIHQQQIPFLIPWAAGTPIVDNGYQPNFVFRLSVRDQWVGPVLVQHAQQRGLRATGMLLENTGWGRSNELSVTVALKQQGLAPKAVRYFNWGEQQFEHHLRYLMDNGADHIVLVANAREGAHILTQLQQMPQQLPVLSHWGIAAGDLLTSAQLSDQLDLHYLTTWLPNADHGSAIQKQFIQRYCKRFSDCQQWLNRPSAMGSAHSYDLVKLLALAVTQAGSIIGSQVQQHLEALPPYQGVTANFEAPFSRHQHDALTPHFYQLVSYR